MDPVTPLNNVTPHSRTQSSASTIFLQFQLRPSHLHEMIDFGDELHISVFDSVVYHFHEMSRTTLTDPIAARSSFYFGSDCLEDISDVGPGLWGATGHDGGAVTGAVFAPRHPGADEMEA